MAIEVRTVRLSEVRIDGGTQQRESISQETIDDYAEAYKEGATLPPVRLVFDGADYWLWDGFQRLFARRQAGFEDIEAEVREGTRRHAFLFSLGANHDNGLRRTSADKRKAVVAALTDPECRQWSDNRIANELCFVSHKTVSAIRREIESTWEIPKSTQRIGSDGRTIIIENIGKSGSGGSSFAPPEPDGGADEASEVLDALCRPVPKALEGVFRASRLFNSLALRLAAVQTEADAIARTEAGAWIRQTALKADLDNAKRHLRFAAPHAICPYCAASAKRKDCAACRGLGWVNKELYEAAPDDLRK